MLLIRVWPLGIVETICKVENAKHAIFIYQAAIDVYRCEPVAACQDHVQVAEAISDQQSKRGGGKTITVAFTWLSFIASQ